MRSQANSKTKLLLIILAILVIVAITMGIWQIFYSGIKFVPVSIKNDSPVVVRPLASEKEQTIGTIIYPGVNRENITVLKNDLAQKVTFDVQDSPDGVINIYAQDLLNRYGDIDVSRKEIQKSDAIGKKAIVLTGSRKTGKIIVTTWLNQNGLTGVTIEKDNSF